MNVQQLIRGINFRLAGLKGFSMAFGEQEVFDAINEAIVAVTIDSVTQNDKYQLEELLATSDELAEVEQSIVDEELERASSDINFPAELLTTDTELPLHPAFHLALIPATVSILAEKAPERPNAIKDHKRLMEQYVSAITRARRAVGATTAKHAKEIRQENEAAITRSGSW